MIWDRNSTDGLKSPFQYSACIDCLYTEFSFLERFAAAKQDGFEYVEFWSWEDRDLDALKEAATEAGIGISGFNGDADYSLIDPAHKQDYIEALEKSIAAALQVGAKSLTIHSNALGEGGKVLYDYRELSDTVKLCTMYDNLLECAIIADHSGINLNLEALNIRIDHVGNYLVYSSDAADLTRMIGSPRLKILFDVYHMQLNEGNLCSNLSTCIDQIGHIHVADAPGRYEPGTGEINYRNIFRHLQNLGYQGLIGYELFPESSTAEAVRAIKKYQL